MVLKEFMTRNVDAMKVENIGKLMESICFVCTKHGDDQQVVISLKEICQLPLGIIEKAQIE